MSDLVLHRNETPGNAIALPAPRNYPIIVREATLNDVPFIDQLQRKHARMVGWFPKGQIEGCIKEGNVVIAEQTGIKGSRDQGSEDGQTLTPRCLDASMPRPVGYCIAKDKYLKREDLGICYQLNVVPEKQRGLIGATLLKEVFNRAAYGCRLFCCWCAQDLAANRFWESMGFIPLAFRTGSRTAGSNKTPRIHIFWQRRIREGDTETPYWFPSETSGGALKENRLVLPIPPGTHWSDAKPAILPGMERVNVLPPGERDESARKNRARSEKKQKPTVAAPAARPRGGLWFVPPPPAPEEKAKMKAEKPKREKFKNDPKLVAAARELRDRYMEQVNLDPAALLPPSAHGKYDVSRQLEAAPSVMKVAPAIPMLDAA